MLVYLNLKNSFTYFLAFWIFYTYIKNVVYSFFLLSLYMLCYQVKMLAHRLD